MAELPRPVSRVLRPPLDEMTERRAWNAIEEGRERAHARAGSTRARVVVGTLALVACAIVVVAWRPWDAPPMTARSEDGPLRTASGEALPMLVLQRGTTSRTIRLSDGSTLGLSKGARARVLDSSGRAFVAVLETGKLDVHVVPGGPRRWVIECGAASVAVVGTRFSVERDDRRVSIRVRDGVVEVTPAGTGEVRARLGAGESIDVPVERVVRGEPLTAEAMPRSPSAPTTTVPATPDVESAPRPPSARTSAVPATPDIEPAPRSPSAPTSAAPATPDVEPAARPPSAPTTATPAVPDVEPAPRSPSAPTSVVPAVPDVEPTPAPPTTAAPLAPQGVERAPADWQSRLASGDARGAWTVLSPGERSRILATGTAEELLRLADAARLSSHPADAARALETLLARFPGHGSASLAAFTLGRLQLDRLGNAARAATAFERALSLGIGRGLREDAMARLVEAHARAGNTSAARAAAARYRAAFPEGRRRAIVERWAPESPP